MEFGFSSLNDIYSLTLLLVLGGVDVGLCGVRARCQVEPFLVYVVNRRVAFGVGCVNVYPVDRLAVLPPVVTLLVYSQKYGTVVMYTNISVDMFLSLVA
jgi:hypothetical protein